MATTTFLGMPPPGIENWIRNGSPEPTPPEPTPTPSQEAWNCSLMPNGAEEPTAFQLIPTTSDPAISCIWAGSSTDVGAYELSVKYEFQSDYEWSYMENSPGGGSWTSINSGITPDLSSPTSIGFTGNNGSYALTRTLS